MSGPFKVSISNQIDAALAAEWRELYLLLPNANPWQAPDFCLAATTMNDPGIQPLILTCRDKSHQLVGILALGNERRSHGPFSIYTIRSLSPRRLDFSDPLAAPGDQAVIAALASALESLRRSGFAFDLRYLLRGNPLLTALTNQFGAIDQLPVRSTELDGRSNWREVIRDGHQRREIDRSRRRLDEILGAAIHWAGTAGEAAEFAGQFVELHSTQQASRNRTSAFATPGSAAGLAGLLATWVPDGAADIAVLRIGREVIAGYILFHRNEVTWAWRTCYSPTHARLSPGSVLLSDAIDRSLARGSRRFNFGFGDERYKHHWSDIEAAAVRITAAPPPHRALPYRLIDRMIRRATPAA